MCRINSRYLQHVDRCIHCTIGFMMPMLIKDIQQNHRWLSLVGVAMPWLFLEA